MPVEIRELVIRATIEDGKDKESASPQKKGQMNKQQIVEECVEQVLEILRRDRER